jgi:Fe-S-cluster-containing dehydrogenase component
MDLEIPACVKACPTGTLIFLDEGQLDDIDSRDVRLKTAEIQRARSSP